MRIADPRAPSGRYRTLAAVVAIGLIVGACGGGPPSAPPSATPVPTPAPTPVAHLSEPVKADSVYLALLAAGLKIAPNNASTGGPGREPVKRINATYAGWPLSISQFSSAKSLQAALDRGLPPKDQVNAYKHLAFIQCANNRLAACREEFRKALTLDPALELSRAEAGHPVWGPIFRSLKGKK